MEIINDTPFEVEALPFRGPEGKTLLSVIVKGTFDIHSGGLAKEASEQLPVAYGDEFYDGGSVKFESDVAPFKPRADIVLFGRAHAPDEREVKMLDVSLCVGEISKTIRVIGDRQWQCLSCLLPVVSSKPQPFTVMELVYERAFGGIDREGGDFCKENLVGRGFCVKKSKKALNGTFLPNLEDPHNLIKSWKDHPKPVGFGFYGKAWMPRASYLGTYDEKWREERSPEPPDDFQYDFYNASHPDLQVEGYLRGDEEVVLVNLSPEGIIRFQLPGIKPHCTVTKSFELVAASSTSGDAKDENIEDYEELNMAEEFDEVNEASPVSEKVDLNLDTLCLIPDERRLYLVWRGLYPINDLTALEVKMIEVSIPF